MSRVWTQQNGPFWLGFGLPAVGVRANRTLKGRGKVEAVDWNAMKLNKIEEHTHRNSES